MTEFSRPAARTMIRHRIRASASALLLVMALALPGTGVAQQQGVDPGLLAQFLGSGTSNSSSGTSTDPSSSQTSSGYTGGTMTQSGTAPDMPYSPTRFNGNQSNQTADLGPSSDMRRPSGTASQNGGTDSTIVERASPGELEKWLHKAVGHPVKRFSSELMLPTARNFALPGSSTIPPDYALNIGDVVSVSITGSMEGSADFTIDRNGQINMPNVGAVTLIGVKYRDLKDRISNAIGRKYRGYDVSVSIAKLRGVRVYVTGFANHPGAWTVNSLATLADVMLAVGGPSAGGSFRSIKLYHNGRELADFDLYHLLRKGDRSHDPVLQNEDVLFIPAVGREVAVVGSVNDEAIYEVKDGESLEDVLRLAGGVTSLADQTHLRVYRLRDANTVGNRQLDHEQAANELAQGGDIIEVAPQGSLVRPLEYQQALVRIEGEVTHPGNYYVPAGTPLAKVVAMAGGFTPRAYLYGTEFYRASVRAQQREAFNQAIDQMETQINTAPVSQSQVQDAATQQVQLSAARAYLQQLRTKQPDGRMVLEVNAQSPKLPDDLVLENNDRIVVPPRIDTVGVFGAVYRPATFLLDGTRRVKLETYIDKAGGKIRGADGANIYVVHASGEVVSKRRGGLSGVAMPGDAIFVPIRAQSNNTWARIKDITTTLFNIGFGALAVKAAF